MAFTAKDASGTTQSFDAAGDGSATPYRPRRATLDGDDIAQGATTDAAKTDQTAAGSVISFLKGLVQLLKGTLTVGGTVAVSNLPATQPVNVTAAASGGVTPYHLVSAASANATSVKGSPGQVFSLSVFNFGASARFLKLYDKATPPVVGTDVPAWTVPVPQAATAGQPGGVVVGGIPAGLSFAAGIALAVTGGLADADATAVGAGEVVVNLGYK